MNRFVVAITGASGVVYGVRLVEELLKRNLEIHIIVSNPAKIVMEQELGWNCKDNLEEVLKHHLPPGLLFIHDNDNIAAPVASGSFLAEGMIVIPCSMSSLSGLASGTSNNLIERTADVMLKEKRMLIVVPRETPLSSIHLRNMLTLSEMGVHIVPAMPAFYNRPESIDDMVSFIVGKVLDAMRIPNNLYNRYD